MKSEATREAAVEAAAKKHILDRPCGCYDRVCGVCMMALYLDREVFSKHGHRPLAFDANKAKEFVGRVMNEVLAWRDSAKSIDDLRDRLPVIDRLAEELSRLAGVRDAENDKLSADK